MHLDIGVQPLLGRTTIHDDRAQLRDGRTVGHDVCQRAAPTVMMAAPMLALLRIDAHAQRRERYSDVAVVGLEQHVLSVL